MALPYSAIVKTSIFPTCKSSKIRCQSGKTSIITSTTILTTTKSGATTSRYSTWTIQLEVSCHFQTTISKMVMMPSMMLFHTITTINKSSSILTTNSQIWAQGTRQQKACVPLLLKKRKKGKMRKRRTLIGNGP